MDYEQRSKKYVNVQYDEIGTAGIPVRSTRRRNWKPFAIKIPYLVFIALLLLSCVGMLEYLIEKAVPLQVTDSNGNIVVKRQTTPPATTATSYTTNPSKLLDPTNTVSTTPVHTTTTPSTTVNTGTVTNPSKLLDPTTVVTTTPIRTTTTSAPVKQSTVTNKDKLLDATITVPTTPPRTTATPSADDDDDDTTVNVSMVTNKDKLLDPTVTVPTTPMRTTTTPTTTERILTQSVTNKDKFIDPTSTVPTSPVRTTTTTKAGTTGPPQPTQTDTSKLLGIEEVVPTTKASVTNSDKLLPVDKSVSTAPTTSGRIGSTVTDGNKFLTSTPTSSPNTGTTSTDRTKVGSAPPSKLLGTATTPTNNRANTTTQPRQTVPVTSTLSNGQVTTITPTDADPTQAEASPTPTDFTPVQKLENLRKPNLRLKGNFTYFTYFLAMYLPSLIAVVLREFWYLTASGLKMMEPFYKLNKPYGVTPRDSLMSDYLSSTTSWNTLDSALRGNKQMIAIICVNVIMGFLAPVATESMMVVATYKIIDEKGESYPRNPAWGFNLLLMRVLQGMLVAAAIVILGVALFSWRRRTGVSSNPSKLATMAALLGQSNVVHDLSNIHPQASDEQIEASLAYNRYVITDYKDPQGNYCCGLVKAGEMVPQGLQRLPMEDLMGPMVHGGSQGAEKPGAYGYKRTGWQLAYDIFFIVWVSCILGVIVAYDRDGTSSGFNTFFNSGQFGPKFLLSLGASIAVMTFQDFEREVRLMTPYRELAARHASPRNTVLRPVDGTAFSSVYQSLKYGTWFHFFIAVVTLLGDILVITITGVPYSENTSPMSYMVCSKVSMGISALLILSTIAIFVWRRKNTKLRIPQQPNEVMIRVWMSLSNQSNQLRAMLADAGNAKAKEINERLKYEGGTYWAGWTRDQYGRNVWCVDKELSQLNISRSPVGEQRSV